MEVSRRTVDIMVAAITFFGGAAVMIESYNLGINWVEDSPGSGYFPFRLGAIMALASAGIVAQTLYRADIEDRKPFVTWERFRLVLAVFIPTTAYIASIGVLGLYVASAMFMAGFMLVAGKFSWVSAVGISVSASAVLFWLFEIQFLVPLPKGPLEAMLGY